MTIPGPASNIYISIGSGAVTHFTVGNMDAEDAAVVVFKEILSPDRLRAIAAILGPATAQAVEARFYRELQQMDRLASQAQLLAEKAAEVSADARALRRSLDVP